MDINDRRARLIGWLEAIRKDAQELLLDHHIFWEVQGIVRKNPRFRSASGLFNQWMASSFVQSAAVGIRRHAKAGDDSISLKRLLREVRNYPELVSRDFYLAFFTDSDDWLRQTNGHGHFDSISGAGKPHIATDVIDKQLAELDTALQTVEHYVDRRVAHYDKRGVTHLEHALRVIEEQVIFYWTLLKGVTVLGLTPAIQYNWYDVFAFAWVEQPSDSDMDGAYHSG